MSRTPLIIDANLLVLLVVGLASPAYIIKHKRLQAYLIADFDLLLEIIRAAPAIIFTPNTLTEASNLAGYVAEPARTQIYRTLGALIAANEESDIPSASAVDRHQFLRLGLTDVVLMEATAESGATLLTVDHDLYQATLVNGGNAINFNHLRERFTL